MRLKDFETLSRLIGGDARKQHSVLKGQFHAYIMRRMRWHARRYYYRNRDKVVVISLEDMNEDVPDEKEEERMLQRITHCLAAGVAASNADRTADRAVPAEKKLQRNCSGYGVQQFNRVQSAP